MIFIDSKLTHLSCNSAVDDNRLENSKLHLAMFLQWLEVDQCQWENKN